MATFAACSLVQSWCRVAAALLLPAAVFLAVGVTIVVAAWVAAPRCDCGEH